MSVETSTGAPISVQESLVALERIHRADDDFAWQVTEEAIASTLSSQDTAKGIQAFLERREPRWSGRETRTPDFPSTTNQEKFSESDLFREFRRT